VKLAGRDLRLVHLNPSFDARSFYRDAVFCALAHLFRKRTLVFFRGWDESFERTVAESWWRRALALQTFGRSGHYVALGRTFEDRLRKMGFRGRFWLESTVAGEAPPSSLNIAAKMQSLQEGMQILFMSRLIRAKGIYLALDAVEQLRKRHPGKAIRLIVAGDGEEREPAIEYARCAGMTFASFVGEIRGADKLRVLQESHVLIFPTFHGEGMPNVILEAMLCGLPIVSRDAGAISDVVTDGINGFVTESESAGDFAAFLGRFLDDPLLFESIATRNAAKACAQYRCDTVRSRLLNIYAEVVQAQDRPAGIDLAEVDHRGQ
jgi:glycosyltransferase involved in cell wall biosynthesis